MQASSYFFEGIEGSWTLAITPCTVIHDLKRGSKGIRNMRLVAFSEQGCGRGCDCSYGISLSVFD